MSDTASSDKGDKIKCIVKIINLASGYRYELIQWCNGWFWDSRYYIYGN